MLRAQEASKYEARKPRRQEAKKPRMQGAKKSCCRSLFLSFLLSFVASFFLLSFLPRLHLFIVFFMLFFLYSLLFSFFLSVFLSFFLCFALLCYGLNLPPWAGQGTALSPCVRRLFGRDQRVHRPRKCSKGNSEALPNLASTAGICGALSSSWL